MSQNNTHKRAKGSGLALDNAHVNLWIAVIAAIVVLLIATAVYLIALNVSMPEGGGENEPEGDGDKPAISDGSYPFRQDIDAIIPDFADGSATVPSEGINSLHSVLVDVTSGEIIASRQAKTTIYPASMTKVMTLIVVYENLKEEDCLSDKITITEEYVEKKIADQHSGDIARAGSEYTVEDLIYALMLDSDGVAALALADYIAGSEAEFVKLMNSKAAEMGLLDGDPKNNPSTNFTNCSGIHENYHYTTCQDMAAIMMYAMENTFCANVLSALSYTGTQTSYHDILVTKLHNDMPAQTISPENVDIVAAKSGWAGDESGYCLATFARGDDGHSYVLVTAEAPDYYGADGSQFAYVEDMVAIYDAYVD